MESTMAPYVKSGCKIIVTACRTIGNIYNNVKDYLGRDDGFDILWLTHRIYDGESADEVRQNSIRSMFIIVVRLID